MAEGRRRGRTWTIVFVVLLIVLAGLWAGYWYAARTLALTVIARMSEPDSQGDRRDCENLSLTGFPLYIDIRCNRTTVASGDGALTAAVGGISVSAPLYRPGSVEATLDGPFVINIPGQNTALTTNWSQATGSVSIGLGGLQSAGGAFESLTATSAGGTPLKDLSAKSAKASIETQAGDNIAIAASTSQLSVTLTDGRAFPAIDTDVQLVALAVEGGLNRNPARTLLAWARNGGAVQIDKVRIAAAGAILNLSGRLSVSSAGLLNGTIVIQYNDIQKLAQLIDTFRPGTTERRADALEKLNSVTAVVDSPDGPMHQTSVSFIEGSVWLGVIPLPVDPVPPIHL